MPPGTQSPEEVVKYLLLVMKHSDIKPDYHAIAQEAGFSNANTAQKRFKKHVESNGFRLVAGAVLGNESSADDVSPVKTKAPVKPKVRRKIGAASSPAQAKKRKIKGPDAYEEEEEEDEKEDVKEESGTVEE